MYNFLKNNKALYHKNCYGKYREDKLKKIILKSNDTKVAETKDLRKRSFDRNLGELQCGAFDIQKNLYMAAEVKRKSGTEVNEHLKAKTENWRNLAKTPGYENLHAMICVGDLKSNEIFYHLKCYSKLKRDAKVYTDSERQVPSDISNFKQNYCLRKVYHNVYETLYENPSELIELREVFKDFLELCTQNDIIIKTNITKFKNDLLKVLSDDLEIMKHGKLLYIGLSKSIKDTAAISMKTKTFSQKLTEISKIIRKDIKDFNNNNTQLVGSFAENCEVNALPKSFLQLMSSILEGDCTKV